MLDVNANLFRIAALAQSREETRYYLNGVFVEPHAIKGVTMTATDGHVLVSIYDETGTCEKPVIVQLAKAALQSCKAAKKDIEPRRLVMSDLGNAFVRLCGKDVGISSQCIVDGTFPDWRSVVNSSQTKPLGDGNSVPEPAFNHSTLRVFCDIARELSDGEYRSLLITSKVKTSAALVRFDGVSHAFGLIMPLKHDTKPELPFWYRANERVSTAQAA